MSANKYPRHMELIVELIFMSDIWGKTSPACKRWPLQKSGKVPSRRVGSDSPGPWLPADTKRGPGSDPKGVGGSHRERHFCQ